MKPETNNYEQLKSKALNEGAGLFGVADLKNYNTGLSDEIAALAENLKYGVSVGVELCAAVLDTVKEKPTLIYSWHYRQINTLLDKIALNLARFIQEKNYRALPIAASQVTDWHKQTAHVSHKHIANLAGLGWLGRNNLLVTKKFGSALRLVSVLTDMPLATDSPCPDNCRNCRLCLSACPAGAIGENVKDFKHQACFEKLKEFSKIPGIKYYICGVCVRACGQEKA
ncbi:MAG: hypothetical protein KKF93_03225 [Candidatus Omnitrophica bacterium]|nr:hypothetical protein [Candidatus Omnitrophota bacterium]